MPSEPECPQLSLPEAPDGVRWQREAPAMLEICAAPLFLDYIREAGLLSKGRHGAKCELKTWGEDLLRRSSLFFSDEQFARAFFFRTLTCSTSR